MLHFCKKNGADNFFFNLNLVLWAGYALMDHKNVHYVKYIVFKCYIRA